MHCCCVSFVLINVNISCLEAEEVKKLKNRVSTLEGISSSMNAHTSRLTGDDVHNVNSGGVKSAYENTLDLGSTGFSGSLALQRNIQQTLRTELQSEAMKGMKSHKAVVFILRSFLHHT